ncbi:FxsA family protein [Mycobacterium talmoniae]|uniref:Membrane protein FxsA n=1 Tax=Mycobacterium talmoniae TaxID=1858794 RepID=A0A1S1NNI4_9MYCO|nr:MULTISPECIES: FxsA family protein [Mycobacterium]OHV05878.1 membrane protein FxsA [Mycobacterium talmoniae]TDH57782.1 membrane protein FxsA [Mycobacterium eburneum]
MGTRLFLGYAVVELAVLVALTSTIGFGWTLLLLTATFVGGLLLAGAQARRQLRRLRSGGALTDSALVALGTVLVIVPGLVSTVAGLLLLVPATRAIARPVVAALAVRGIGRRAPLVTVMTGGAPRTPSGGHGDYIDGEVIDVTEVPAPALYRHAD